MSAELVKSFTENFQLLIDIILQILLPPCRSYTSVIGRIGRFLSLGQVIGRSLIICEK